MIKKKLKLDLPDEIINKIESFYSNHSFESNKLKLLKLYNPTMNYTIKGKRIGGSYKRLS